MDELTQQIKLDLEVPANRVESAKDLPIAEIMTNSLIACKAFVLGKNAVMFKNDNNLAIKALEQATKLDPAFAIANISLAGDYRRLKLLDEAIQQYEKALEIDPDQWWILHTIGYIYQQQGKFDLARQKYQRYAEQFPNEAGAFRTLADLFMTMGKYDLARRNYEKALLLGDEENSAALFLADIEARLGNFGKADSEYKRLLTVFNDPKLRSQLYSSMQNFYQLRGRHTEEKIHLAIKPVEKLAGFDALSHKQKATWLRWLFVDIELVDDYGASRPNAS